MTQVNLLQKRERLTKGTYGYQGEGQREGVVQEFLVDNYTLLYLQQITNKNLLYSIEKSAQCYVEAWMRWDLDSMGTWVYVYPWLCPFAPPETIKKC